MDKFNFLQGFEMTCPQSTVQNDYIICPNIEDSNCTYKDENLQNMINFILAPLKAMSMYVKTFTDV